VRTFWITITILVAAALAALFLIPPTTVVPSSEVEHVTIETPTAPPNPTPAIAATFAKGLDQQIKDAIVQPGKLVEKDGAITADGKYVIQGMGTKEEPYEVTWEILMSASDTYIPRLGQKEIPQRIAMLNGAYIRISGFVAFPLVTTETTECLVMLNQWDGCCIGVPPSPYDAIEVKLLTPADNSKRHIVRVGTLEGIFHIDPYVVEKWLVGLYTMDNAELSTEM